MSLLMAHAFEETSSLFSSMSLLCAWNVVGGDVASEAENPGSLENQCESEAAALKAKLPGEHSRSL